MKRLVMALVIAAAFCSEAAAQSTAPKPDGEMRWALYVTLAPAWFDPGEITGGFLTPFWVLYAMHDALVKPMPGNLMAPSLAESWTVSADQHDVRLQAARGPEVPQRRSVHRGRREVQLPALEGRQGAQGPRARRRDRQPVARALPPARAVPRLHGVLRHAGHGRGLDRAEEVRREGRRRRLQEAPDRARALQVREPHARRRAGHGGLRGLLAQDALREAAGLQERSRADHARGHAEERRGRRRLHARHADRAGAQARSELPARASRARSACTTWTSSTSGIRSRRGTTGACGWPPTTPSIARRSARPRRSAPRARPAAWLRARSTSRCALPPYAYDPGEGQAAPRRGRLSERLRRRRLLSLPALLVGGRDDRRLLRRGRHPDEAAHDGARGLPDGVGAARSSTASASARWRTSATRPRASPTSVQSDGAYARGADPDVDALFKQQARETDREEARGHAPPDPADALRSRALRPALRVHLGERHRPARGRAGPDADRSVPVVGAAARTSGSRGSEPPGPVRVTERRTARWRGRGSPRV